MSISKQLVCQKYIYKIHSSRLRKEGWDLSLSLEEAHRNDEIIALADSLILRWIDELNGIEGADERAREIKTEIRSLRKGDGGIKTRRKIKALYEELDNLQFKPDYMSLIIDRNSDYYRACKGFSVNGVRYKRLLGTNGGIKNSTIVFVSERLHGELSRRIENGRNPDKELVTAKLEAYKALTCSASIPVSMPHGVLIVNDAETEFFDDILYLTDEDGGEPVMERRPHEHIKLDATDGCGMMLPSLAKRWGDELELGYTPSGLNSRMSFEKGMVYTFDFIDFAEKVAADYLVKDAWGDTVDVRDVELVLTTSMVKLWDSYRSCDDYINTSISNGYTFSVTKVCPENLESERNLNYQFIQSYDLSDAEIEELARPTMDEIRDVLGGDWRKTLLFLRGSDIKPENVLRVSNDYIKAIMVDRRMLDDPYVQSSIYRLIKNRINDAKIGVLKVHGNYSIISGDPYLLCQSMFGIKLTGLLKAGEIYNRYWADAGAEKLACFRAPMSCHNNIRIVRPVSNDEASYWYRYMTTCTIFNAWDTSLSALNGADCDGDMVLLTDNRILVEKCRQLPTLMCAQRNASKSIPEEEDFVRSNIDSFGNDIGKTTNHITAMFDTQSFFPFWSKEYETLGYRIMCGQLYQQNEIDKAKGIICNPMPRSWYDRHALGNIKDESTRIFYKDILSSKKPYFMRYIYPSLMKEYNDYIKNSNKNSLRRFGMTIEQLYDLDYCKQTEAQAEFLKFYEMMMPVSNGNCVMNRICRMIEDEFDGYIKKHNASTKFDYRILKSGAEYSRKQFHDVSRLYEDYNRRVQTYCIIAGYEKVMEWESSAKLRNMDIEFRRQCDQVCPNRYTLCDIILDLCYRRGSTKRFSWSMCGATIIDSLLEKNNHIISFPVLDPDGDIEFGGKVFRLENINTLEVSPE